MEKLNPETENKNIRFLWLKAFFVTVKDMFGGKKPWESQKAKAKAKPAPRKAADTDKGNKGRGVLFVTADIVLLASFVLSALFCTLSFVLDDGRANIVLYDGGRRIEYNARVMSVGEFLAKENIQLGEKDILSPKEAEMLCDDMEICITRAFPVAVESQGKVTIVDMTEGTVGDALALAGVEYDTDDELSSFAFADVEAGMKITHTDVSIEYKSSYEPLEFNEVTVKDSSMYKGESEIVVEGQDGEKLTTRRITYKDGYEFAKEIVDRVVIKEAVDQVTNVGTKVRYQTNYVGEWREYKAAPKAGVDGWVEMTVDYITAYSGDPITAMGTVPKLGTIAVTPQYIPYYSQIYVKNYGYGTALDTGAFRNRFENGKRVNQLDLFFNTESECTRWGRKRNQTILVKLKK